MSKILCTICARGGSKGVKNKNIKDLHGRPLIAYTIEQALNSGFFEHVVVSTDSDAIAEVSVKNGAEVFFKRDAVMSSDTAGKLQVIRDAFQRCEEYYHEEFDYLVDLDATSPLRNIEDISKSLDMLITQKNCNLITGFPSRRNPYFNMVEVDDLGSVSLSKKLPNSVLRRQDAPKCYDMNASIYIWTRASILNDETIFNPTTGLYVMPEERSIDIDSELDFKFVEFLMKHNDSKVK